MVFFPQLDPYNTGDDVAGIVQVVGPGVTEFKVGDRVAAFHEMMKPHGSFAEYAVVEAHTTFHIPEETSFEEAATIPLAGMTAVIGLVSPAPLLTVLHHSYSICISFPRTDKTQYARLGLPEPWASVHAVRPLAEGGVVIYGAATAVGAFAIKLLVLANVHPIIAVAGRASSYVESLIDRSKGDTIIDYRGGDEKVVQELKAAIPSGKKLLYAFDAVSEHNSYQNIVQVLDPEGHLTLVLPGKEYEGIPKSVKMTMTTVGSAHGQPVASSSLAKSDDLSALAFAWFRLFGQGLKQGWFSGHPFEVVPGGLAGVETGLKNLLEGKASAVKYVYRVEETEGAGQDKL